MLKVPAFRYFSEFRVTAYQDDTQFWKFYLIPDYVSIRRDFQGNPVFMLIKYAFSDEDREDNPDLPKGGGYMVLDIEMSVNEADEKKIVEQLQKDVNEIWNQLKAIAEAGGQPIEGARLNSWHNVNGVRTNVSLSVDDVLLGLGPDSPAAPPGNAAPKVILSHPTWTEGKFSIMAPQSERLVSHRVTEGPVSLIGNNVVSANLDLTAAGATFMERTLLNPDGGGGPDLTPLQALYELKFWARVPPVRLRITADSRELYAAIDAIAHDYTGRDCSEDEINHSEHHLKMAIQSGLIKVHIDAGTLELDDDFLQELRSGALKTVMDIIKEKFFDKKTVQNPPPTEEEKDYVERESDLYMLKTDLDFTSMHIEYDETIESIQQWKINPQGTLQTFLADVSPAEMRKYVRTVDLDDNFFKSLNLRVNTFANWEDEPIAFIEAQIRYTGMDENNQFVEKVQTFTFTKDKTSDVWDPSLIGAKREYSYRSRVGFQGHAAGPFTNWSNDTSPNLNISVADPGKVAIRVLSGNIDFAQITKQVQVEIRYRDPFSGVLEEATTLIFNAGEQAKDYERYIFTDWDQAAEYRTHFFLKNGQTIDQNDWKPTTSRQLIINEPDSINKLDVQLVPAGDWSQVAQSVVELRYADAPNNYFAEGFYQLKSIDGFNSWYVVLKDPNKRSFEYRISTTFKNGSPAVQTNWIPAQSDQVVLVDVKGSPSLKVDMLPNAVDFTSTPVVITTLRYDDSIGNIHAVESFAFTGPVPATWSLPIADRTRLAYRYQVSYTTRDGEEVNKSETPTDRTKLALLPLDLPVVAASLEPKLVNFTQTPVVEVNIQYQDPNNGLEFNDTLIFTENKPQSFRFPVHENSPREYTITTTYYLSDGTIVPRPPVTTKQNRITVPLYRAEV